MVTERTPVTRRATGGERQNRDAEVMATAIQVMSERGYAATSMQEIAERVGMLKGSLYHYFASKEELLMRILEESHAQITEIRQKVADRGLDPLEELLQYLQESTFWYLANVERANIFFTDRRHLTEERLELAQQQGREFERHIQALVRDGQANGSIRQDQDARLIARFVLGAINNVRFWPNRSAPGHSTEEIAKTLVALTRSALAA